MSERAWLMRYAAWGLAVVGGLDWLLGRTVSRLAAAPQLEGQARLIVEGAGRIGLFLVSPAFILVALLLLLSSLELGVGTNRRRNPLDMALAFYLLIFGAFTVGYSLLTALSLLPAQSWLVITFNILSLSTAWWLTLRYALDGRRAGAARTAIALITLSYTGWYYYVLQQQAPSMGASFAGAPVLVLDLGEWAAVASVFFLFTAIALPANGWRRPLRWALPLLLAGAFSVGNIADMLANQGFTGVFTVWSVGFYFTLPWPVYALALALFVYSVLTCFSSAKEKGALANANTGLALLLLVYAGHVLQLPYQHLLALFSLMLFTEIAQPFGAKELPQTLGNEQRVAARV